MRQLLTFLSLFCFALAGSGQTQNPRNPTSRGNESLSTQSVPVKEKAPITDYKIISIAGDTTFVDTTLTIYKDYEFNYLRRDRFELLPFSNVGQTYNRLSYDFEESSITPEFGARARHFNYFEIEDIKYYRVPTPLTELFFRTVFEQGQAVDAFFTVNTSPNFNFSVAYKGLRSLGKYRHILTSSGNFRATVNYHTRDNRYRVKAHFVSQDLMNQENGGLTPRALEQYIAENEEFQDRSRLDVNFEDAESTLFGKRFFLHHSYHFNPGTTAAVSDGLVVGHVLNFRDKEYLYEQASASPLFGPAFESVGLRDHVELEEIYNEGFVGFGIGNWSKLRIKGGYRHYNYGYNSVLNLESGTIVNRLIGNVISGGGTYEAAIGDFGVFVDGSVNLAGDFDGYDFTSGLSYSLREDLGASFTVKLNNRTPNFNFLLYQSDYMNYNWQPDVANMSTQQAALAVSSSYLDLVLDYTQIDNYAYFGIGEDNLVRPMQHSGAINYVRAKAQREFVYGRFGLNNTLLYQSLLQGYEVLNVPSFISRHSLYYQDYWFQRALYLQTGLTLNYFTDYHMNGYDPVLSEFYVQNEVEMEGFPRVDFFFNGKIRQARIFFKLEHVNSLLTGNNYFSAPLYPYRDFGVRFGVVWNFFL